MPSSIAKVQTEHASKYLQQLCKHWSHKLDVEFDPSQGVVHFDGARLCRFAAENGRLDMKLETATEEELERTQQTLVNHLKRFAFREDFGDIAWEKLS
jgi:uncharacterized protein